MAKSLLDLFNSGDDYLSSVNTEIGNTRKRLNWIGYGEEAEPERSESMLSKAFKVLGKFGHGGSGALAEVLAPGLGSTPNQFDPLRAFQRGWSGEEQLRGKDIASYWGASSNPWFEKEFLDGKLKVAPSTAGILGFGLDVLNPADPLNWLTFGVGSGVAKGAAKGLPQLEKAFGKDTAQAISTGLGGRVDNLSGRNVGELLNNVLRQAQQSNKLGRLSDKDFNSLKSTLTESLRQTKLNKKLPTEKKNITAGLSVPIINKNVANFAIPGTAPVVTSMSKAKEKLSSTGIGEAFGKAFSTSFVSPKRTREVYRLMRDLEGEGNNAVRQFDNLTPQQTGQELGSLRNELFDTTREQVAGANRLMEETMRGIPEDRRRMLTYELSPAGRFTGYFENLPPNVAIEEVKKLGFSDQEALAAKMFHDLRKGIIKDFQEIGIPIDERYSWVPHIFKRPPTGAEAGVLRLAFGEKAPQVSEILDDALFEAAARKYPYLRERVLTSGALSPHEINAVLGQHGFKPLLSEDLYHIMSTVQEKFIRSKEAVAAVNKIKTQYGLTVGDLRNMGNTFVPEGYGLFKITTDKQGKTTFAQVDAQAESNFMRELVTGKKGEGAQDVIALPTEIARVWDDYSKLHYNVKERNAFLRFFDKATSQFRTLAYMVTPGHIPRDFASNMYNLWLMGMRTLKNLPVAAKLARHVEQDIILPTKGSLPQIPNNNWTYLVRQDDRLVPSAEPTGDVVAYINKRNASSVTNLLNKKVKTSEGELSYFDVINESSKRGVIDTGWWSIEGPDTKAMNLATWRDTPKEKLKQYMTLNPQKHVYTQKMVSLTKKTDNTSRIMGFMHNLQKGDDLGTAASKIKAYLFDYSDLTPFEQQWMRRLFPFYIWMRKNIPLQIKEAFRQPGKLGTVGKYHEGMGEEQDPDKTPSFMEESESILMPGGELFLTPPMPYQDLARLPKDMDTMSEQFSNVNPLLRILPELAMNKQFFSGVPIEQYKGENMDNALGRMDLPFVSKERGLGYLMDNVPLYRNVATMAPLVDNGEDAKAFSRFLSFMGGPQTFDRQRAEEIAAYEERDRLRAIVRLLKDAGIEIPGVRDLPF